MCCKDVNNEKNLILYCERDVMKKFKSGRSFYIVLLVLLCIFVMLFLRENKKARDQQEKIDALAMECLADAHDAFSRFAASGEREAYLFGTSAFYLFKELYPETSEYRGTFASEVSKAYAKLLFGEENCDEAALQALIGALELLAEDDTDIRGYTMLQMFAESELYEE